MGFFPFLESFFFLSLGITFVLIFLIVFHFKQRIEQLEHKHDEISDLCNQMIQRIEQMNMFIKFSKAVPYIPETNSHSKLTENITFSTSSPIPFPNDNQKNTGYLYPKIKIEDMVLETNREEEEEDEEEESDDEEGGNEVEDDAVQQMLQEVYNGKNVIEGNDLYFPENELEVEELLHIGEEVELDLENEELDNIETQNSSWKEEFESSLEEVKIESENLEEKEKPTTEYSVPTENDLSKPDYSKFNVKQLKQIVVSNGLSTDPSKLKREELLRLLA